MIGERPPATEVLADEEREQARRQAKLDWLVKEGLFKPEEFEGKSPEELDELLGVEFDPYYSQDVRRPEVIREKTAGQNAEEILVEFINKLNLGIRAEKTRDVDDQGREKIDILLYVPGSEAPVHLQATQNRNPEVARKIAKLPERTIPVFIPDKIFEAAQLNNIANIRSVVDDVIRQAIHGMAQRPYYRAELRALRQAYLKHPPA